MAKWTTIGTVADFPPGEPVCTSAENRSVVVFNVEGELFAVLNSCPHAGMPLDEGECRGTVLTCPFHGYAYDLKTGRNVDWPDQEPPATTFELRIEGEEVQVDLQAIEASL
jgi:nitrite reductase/ring-hydroxylating ferredoxin subunit